MNNLERYVEYVQPVVKVVRENHNMFHRLEYYNLSAEDLYAENGLIEYQVKIKISLNTLVVIYLWSVLVGGKKLGLV
jgi:hypothetical protein